MFSGLKTSPMIEVEGDLFSQDCDALCITTNGQIKKDGCAVMGRGVALHATKIWDDIDVILGLRLTSWGNHCHVLKSDLNPQNIQKRRLIISFPVKDKWQEMAKLNLIKKSCLELRKIADTLGFQKICLPRPGCGNGQRDWSEVKPILQKYFNDRFVVVEKYQL